MNRHFPFGLALSLCASGQTTPSHPVFETDQVHIIRVRFAQPGWYDKLAADSGANEDEKRYTEASLEWGDWKFDSIGIRVKGNSSYRGATTKKKPFRIKLNEFTKGQKIEGIASFSLSNAWSDPSFVREKAYYEFAAAAGRKSPRSSFAALYINEEYWAVCVLTQAVTGDSLQTIFGKRQDSGNLQKADSGTSLAHGGLHDPALQRADLGQPALPDSVSGVFFDDALQQLP